jgi:hypothetical protein
MHGSETKALECFLSYCFQLPTAVANKSDERAKCVPIFRTPKRRCRHFGIVSNLLLLISPSEFCGLGKTSQTVKNAVHNGDIKKVVHNGDIWQSFPQIAKNSNWDKAFRFGLMSAIVGIVYLASALMGAVNGNRYLLHDNSRDRHGLTDRTLGRCDLLYARVSAFKVGLLDSYSLLPRTLRNDLDLILPAALALEINVGVPHAEFSSIPVRCAMPPAPTKEEPPSNVKHMTGTIIFISRPCVD